MPRPGAPSVVSLAGVPSPQPDAPAALAHAPREAPASRDLRPVLAMAGLFLLSILLAGLITPTFSEEGLQAFENPDDPTNPIVYLVIVIGFTFVILLLAKYGARRVIQAVILGAVFVTLNYVFWPLLGRIFGDAGLALPVVGFTPASFLIALLASTSLAVLLYRYPEWYVIDAVGVVVSAGTAAIFGISFSLRTSLLLLVGFAIYDAIAVYRTKHMLDLADSVLELRLPIMFVVPKGRGYSFLREERRLKEKLESGEEREAMFMGLGDVVIPGVLIISSFHFLNPATYAAASLPAWAVTDPVLGLSPWVLVALATLLGTLAGYAALMYFVLKGNPQAGLPLLNGGAILGFFAGLIPVYGLAPLLGGGFLA